MSGVASSQSMLIIYKKRSQIHRQTLDIVLKDFSEDGEECFLKAADCSGV